MSTQSSKYDGKDSKQRDELMQQMQFFGQMASTEAALFHQAAAAKAGLGVTDMKTISTLQQEGSMTVSEIAKRLSLTTGAVTNVVDRLEKHDLVKRTADKTDRRKTVVVLEADRLGDIDAIYQSMGVAFQKVLQGYSTKELALLLDFYKTTVEMTKSEVNKLNGEQ